VSDRAEHRFRLVYVVLVAECHRAGPPNIHRWAAAALPYACKQVGSVWTGRLEREWILGELGKVMAEPGEYAEGSYERFRLLGLPIWAALAAGMTPTPGSHKILGRRPNLP
jgi:hypothetical protein